MTYRPILAIDRLAQLHHSLMRIGGYGVGSSSYGVGRNGFGMSANRDGVCVQSQLGLGSEWSGATKQEHI